METVVSKKFKVANLAITSVYYVHVRTMKVPLYRGSSRLINRGTSRDGFVPFYLEDVPEKWRMGSEARAFRLQVVTSDLSLNV